MSNSYIVLMTYLRIRTEVELPRLTNDAKELITLLKETYLDWEIGSNLTKKPNANNLYTCPPLAALIAAYLLLHPMVKKDQPLLFN